MEKPIKPKETCIFPYGAPFLGNTVYTTNFIPREVESVVPIVPCGNILLSDEKMSTHTTNQVRKSENCYTYQSDVLCLMC